MIPVTVSNLRAGGEEVQPGSATAAPSHGLIRLLIILFPFDGRYGGQRMNDSPLHKELPFPDYDAGAPQLSSVPGPPVNPPSQGDPTNPAQPRK